MPKVCPKCRDTERALTITGAVLTEQIGHHTDDGWRAADIKFDRFVPSPDCMVLCECGHECRYSALVNNVEIQRLSEPFIHINRTLIVACILTLLIGCSIGIWIGMLQR